MHISVVYLERIQEQTSMVLLDFNWYPLTDSKRAVSEVRRTCYSCVNRDWVLFAAVCFGCFRCIRWDFSCWEFENIFVWFTHSRVHLPHPRPTRWARVAIIGHCAKQASDARARVGCVRGVQIQLISRQGRAANPFRDSAFSVEVLWPWSFDYVSAPLLPFKLFVCLIYMKIYWQ